MVLDGRLKSNPDPLKKFSLFFVVPMTENEKDANMKLVYSEITKETTVTLIPDGKQVKISTPGTKSPQVDERERKKDREKDRNREEFFGGIQKDGEEEEGRRR